MRFLVSLLGPQWKFWLILAAVAAVGAIGFRAYQSVYDKGAQDTINEIEDLNDELEGNAIDARDALRRCRDLGGVYDFATGKCGQPDASGGD
ncbi:hypothetical protein PVV74_11865 [Roseovarius sp. SK2]|uniref:hypothetical protein n=1 Tax=Roseovarius TaxID=74030 RepID=UPI00237BF619|nr:hypothetical protein [Roseovarius sp. SK2]MDD9726154.1 hypothetical protein [Roseovarius sp. SK2]